MRKRFKPRKRYVAWKATRLFPGGLGPEGRGIRRELGSDRSGSPECGQDQASVARSLGQFTHALFGLDQMNGVALSQVIALKHGLGDGRTGRVADGTERFALVLSSMVEVRSACLLDHCSTILPGCW